MGADSSNVAVENETPSNKRNARSVLGSKAQPAGPHFGISFPKERSSTPLDGHVLLVLAKNNNEELRFQISFMTAQSQQIFGVDADALAPAA